MLTPALFSISYAGLWGQAAVDLPSFVARAAELGFKHVMLAGKRPHVSILDMQPAAIESLSATLRQSGIMAPIVAAYIDTAGGTAAEVPYLEMQIAYVQRLAEIGKALGASIVRVFTAYEAAEGQTATLWNRTVAMLGEMSDRLAPLGMTLAVQNHHDLAVETAALVELLSDVDRPNCKLGFDAWSPALRGENLYEAARTAAPYTAITTNADYVRFRRFAYRPDLVNYAPRQPDWVRAVSFGTGFIDYQAFFTGLVEGGFRGPAVYEMCSPLRGGGSLDNLDRYARAYLSWLREHGFTH